MMELGQQRNEQRRHLIKRFVFVDESIEYLESEVGYMMARLLHTHGPEPESVRAKIRQTQALIRGLNAELGAIIERVDELGFEDEQ